MMTIRDNTEQQRQIFSQQKWRPGLDCGKFDGRVRDKACQRMY